MMSTSDRPNIQNVILRTNFSGIVNSKAILNISIMYVCIDILGRFHFSYCLRDIPFH